MRGSLPIQVLICVLAPKNSRHMGFQQFSWCDDGATCVWMLWLHSGLIPSARLCSVSYAQFRQIFAELVKLAGLDSVGFTPGSLRAGGATLAFRVTKNMALVKFWGRWKSEASVAHYVQLATSTVVPM